jgi:hypothetical protein
MNEPVYDAVNHPRHYNNHPSGIECIDVTRLCLFDMGNAIKYVWRHPDKNGDEDLRKASFYLLDILMTGQSQHPPYKARALLDHVIKADDVPLRGQLLDLIRCGRLGDAVLLIDHTVGDLV